jgi:hypothetical protein
MSKLEIETKLKRVKESKENLLMIKKLTDIFVGKKVSLIIILPIIIAKCQFSPGANIKKVKPK